MINVEQEYTVPAIKAALEYSHLMPESVVRKLRLALSVINSNGTATTEEFKAQLGNNWVISRRTKDIVERYGEDVKCYTQKQYNVAERKAIESRDMSTAMANRPGYGLYPVNR